MSYKHNNLMAMRQSWWNDDSNSTVQSEKQFMCHFLTEQGLFQPAELEDVRYFFFSMPSIIIVKGYAEGFQATTVQQLMQQYITQNKDQLMQRNSLKIQYQM